MLGTLIGTFIGKIISDPEKIGLNFAITALFVGIVYFQIISDKKIKIKNQLIVVFTVLISMYFCMGFMPCGLVILVSTLIGCIVGGMLKNGN